MTLAVTVIGQEWNTTLVHRIEIAAARAKRADYCHWPGSTRLRTQGLARLQAYLFLDPYERKRYSPIILGGISFLSHVEHCRACQFEMKCTADWEEQRDVYVRFMTRLLS